MEKIEQMKELFELMTAEAEKVYYKGNRTAATRARKFAQDIKNLLGEFRKELLEKSKK